MIIMCPSGAACLPTVLEISEVKQYALGSINVYQRHVKIMKDISSKTIERNFLKHGSL
jgi:hypothetical protein